MIELFLWFACVLYALEYTYFLVGLLRLPSLRRSVPQQYPSVSILVAARNEARNIERCLHSLLAQDYPVDRLQIIAVNDESDDATLSLMESVAVASSGRLTTLSTRGEHAELRGKARAIAQGIDVASGEIILLTDADCIARPTWARAVVEHFVDGVDVFGGFTVIRSYDFFSAVQRLDWIHLQSLASAGLALGIPLGIIGNNFAFRRSAYEHVGGYRTVDFSVTEDFALFSALRRSGHHVVYACSRDTEMQTQPCDSLAEVLSQKQRWSRGGMQTGARGWAVLVIAMFMMTALVIAPFVSITAWIVVWSTKFAFDLALMTPTLRWLGKLGSLRYFLLFEFYFVAQALVVPILLMNRTVVWKGRAYRS